MQKKILFGLVLFVLLAMGVSGCSSAGVDGEAVSLSAPIHMEMATDNLQPRMGLSGFVLGVFLLMNSYLVLILSCLVLIIRDSWINGFLEVIKTGLSMLKPDEDGQGRFIELLGKISDSDTRLKVGSIGLVAGVLFAYLGAWIAM